MNVADSDHLTLSSHPPSFPPPPRGLVHYPWPWLHICCSGAHSSLLPSGLPRRVEVGPSELELFFRPPSPRLRRLMTTCCQLLVLAPAGFFSRWFVEFQITQPRTGFFSLPLLEFQITQPRTVLGCIMEGGQQIQGLGEGDNGVGEVEVATGVVEAAVGGVQVAAALAVEQKAATSAGRIVDEFRSSLTPRTIEALVCLQDWIRGSTSKITFVEDHKELEEIENLKLLHLPA